MFKKKLLLPSIVLMACASTSAFAFSYSGMQLESKAKISLHQAQDLAEKAYEGTIVEQKLKYALGGSGLRYDFDVVGHHITHEVSVDANTGKILRNERSTDGD